MTTSPRSSSPRPAAQPLAGAWSRAWLLALALCLAGAPGALQAATVTWNGGGDGNWMSGANWIGGNPPFANDSLVFANGTGLAAVNNFPNGTVFTSISFSLGAGNFVLSGNPVVLSGGASAITNSATSGTMTVSLDLTFSTAAPTITTTAGGTLTVSGALANGGMLVTVAANGTANLSGVVSGTGGLTKSGAGTLTMSNTNTYSGNTSANLGILKAGANAAFGAAANVITINAGAALDVASVDLRGYTAAIVVYGTGIDATRGALFSSTADNNNAFRLISLGSDVSIGGPFRIDIGRSNGGTTNLGNGFVLTKIGTGILGILNQSSGLGGVVINAGAVQPESANWSGTAPSNLPITIASGGTLAPYGALSLANPITVNGGTVAVANGGTGQTYTGAITLGSTSTVNTANGAIAINGVIGGAGGLTKAGANALTLGGVNTFTGPQVLNAGSLLVNGSTVASSTVAVSSTATLGGSGTVAGVITMASGSILAPGTGGTTIGNLSTATVTMNAASTYSVDLNGTTPTYDRVTGAGTVTCAGILTVASVANAATGKTYPIISAAVVNGTFNGLGNNAIFSQGGRTYQIVYTGTTVTLTDIAHTSTRVWDGGAGAGDTRWTTAANWDLDQAPVIGDDLHFAGNTTLTPTNDFAAGFSFRSITFDSGAGDFVLGGNQVSLSGGASALVNNATTGTMTCNVPLTCSVSPTIATTAGCTLVLGGAIDNAGLLLTTNASGPLTLGGIISGSGGWTKTGTATVTLGAVNTYTGATALNAGTLRISVPGALPAAGSISMSGTAVLDLNGNNTSVANITASVNTAIIIDNSAGIGTTTLTVTGLTATITALVKDGATQKVALAISNNNINVPILALGNSNTFSGGLTLLHNSSGNGTRLWINGAITNTPFGSGPISVGQSATDRAGIFFNTANQTIANEIMVNTALGTDFPGIRCDTTGIVLSGKITANLAPVMFSTNGTGTLLVSGQITGSAGLTLSNATGTLITVTLGSNANDYAGTTTISGSKDVLQVGSGAAGVLGSASVANAGALTFMRTDSVAVANLISGAGTVTINGGAGSMVTFTGANTYLGATTVSSGTLRNGAAGVLADTNAVTVSAAAVYDLANYNETVGSIAGAGSITLGSATLSAGGNNSSTTFSGTIGGSGSFTKEGTGTLILSGASSYSGTSTMNAGTLRVDADVISATNGPLGNASSAIVLAAGVFTSNTASVSRPLSIAGGVSLEAFGSPRTIASPIAIQSGVDVLMARFVNTSLRAVTEDDWTATRTINGVRVDANVNQSASDAFGTAGERAAYGIGGSDTGWDNFSVQWDGVLRVVTAGTNLYTWSDDGSRVWVDLNHNGVVDSGEWGSNGWGTGQGTVTRLVAGNLPVGTYRIRVQYDEGTGGNRMALTWDDAAHSGGTVDSKFVVPAAQLGGFSVGGSGQDLALTGVISGPGGMAKTGVNVVTVSGANTYGGATPVTAGTLRLGADDTLPDTQVAIALGATFDASTRRDTIGSLVGVGAVTLGAGSVLSTGSDGRSTTYSGIVSGAGGLAKVGSGVFTLAGANTYDGTTTVSVGGLTVSHATGLGSVVGGTTVVGGANLTIAGVAVGAEALTIGGTGITAAGALIGTGTGSLGGAVTLTANTAIAATGTLTMGGAIGDAGGVYGLTKIGSGSLVLGGANSYTGATTLSTGTLLVNGNASAATGAVAVAGGTTIGGTGTIGGVVTLASGAVLSPGVASAAPLTISAPGTALDLSAGGASLPFALGTSSDRVDCTGANSSVKIGGALVVSDAGGLVAGTYPLMTFTGSTSSGAFSTITIPTGFNAVVTIDNTTAHAVLLTVTVANTGLTVAPGGTVKVMTANLFNAQAGSTTAQIVYTLAAAPAHGFLRKNLVALGIGDTFTQADIDSYLISYEHGDLANSSDSLQLAVAGNGGPIATTTVAVTVSGSGLANGLVAYLPFESTSGTVATDQTGAYTGTVNGTATWGAGQIGNALTFDGTSTYVQLPAGMADFTTGLTVSVWAKPTASGSWARFIDFGNGSGSNNLVWARSGTSSDLRTDLYTGATATSATDPGAIVNNAWHHYLFTVTSAGTSNRYRDGVQLNTAVAQSVIPNITRTLNYIGKSNWADALFTGQMDELRIYNRDLNAGEVKLLAQQAAPVLGNVHGDSLLYAGDGSVVALDVGGDATLSDADDLTLAGGYLLVQNSTAVATSLIGIAASGGVTVSGATVSVGGNPIGTIDATRNGSGTDLKVAFTTTFATPLAAQALVRALRFSDTMPAQRIFSISICDGSITPAPALVTMASSTVLSVTTNTGLTVVAGTSGTFATANLAATDTAGQTASQITYAMVRVPAHGYVCRNLILVGIGATFTQNDLNTGLISYEHGDLANPTDDFVLSVSDSLGNNAGAVTVATTATGSGLSTGLLAHWRLDESAVSLTTRDATGRGFTGTLTNMTGSEWGPGQIGNALTFDGNNDLVSVASGISLANSSFTITGWAKRNAIGTADFLFGQGSGATNMGLHFGFLNDNRIRFGFYGNDLDTASAFTDTTAWHHLAGSFNATSKARKTWRDGAVVASGTASANYQGSGAFELGRGGPSGGSEFNGALDGMRIYGRELTSGEIAVLASAPGAPPVIAGLNGTLATCLEEGPAGLLDPAAVATVSDADDQTFAGGSLLVENVSAATTTVLAIANAGGITISGATVSYAGNALGTIGSGVDGTAGRHLRVDLQNIGATPTAVAALIHALTVADTASGMRSVRVSLSDGVNCSNLALVSVTVTPVNDAPVLAINAGLTAPVGGVAVIDNTRLQVTDEDNTAAQLVYTVVAAPGNGHLRDNLVALGVGSTFTQADIDNRLLSYEHGTIANLSDGFTFTVSDGSGGGIATTAVAITISGNGLAQGLAARWALDEGSGSTTADGSGNGNTGTLTNTTWAAARLNSGLTFPGNGYVRVPTSASLDLTSAITVSGWVRTAQSASSSVLRHDGHFTALQPQGGTAQVAYWVGGTLRTYQFPWNGTWTTNTWVHYTASYDQTTGLAIYFNGNRTYTSTTYLGALSTTVKDFMLGADEGGGQRFNGQLDEVRVYGRALSQNEVRVLAQQAVPVISSLDGDTPVFTEDGGAVALDSGTAAVVSDADDTDFGGGFLLVHGTVITAADTLGVANLGSGAGQIGVSGATVSYGGIYLGTIDATDNGIAGADLRIAFPTCDSTPVALTALVRALRFSTAGQTPSTTSRVLQVSLNDNTFTSVPAAVTMGVRATPDLLSRITVDADGDGRIDRIRLGFDQTMNDNFSGLTVTVAGYTVTGYSTGTTANDASIDVLVSGSGAGDTAATPLVRIVANTSLGGATGGALAPAEGAATVADDAALPVLMSVAWSDGGRPGVSVDDRLVMTFSENITAVGLTLADLGLPVAGDSFGSGPIVDQSGLTVSLDLSGTPLFTPTGAYAATALTPGSPTGVFLVATSGITDAVGLHPLVGGAASARDLLIGTPVSTVVDLNGPAAGTGYATAFFNQSPAIPAVDAAALTVTDSDQTTVDGASIVLTNPLDLGAETIDVTVSGAIAKSWNAATTTLTLTGTDTLAQYQAVLRTLTYLDTTLLVTAGDRLITVAADDGHGLGTVSTAVIAVAYNTPPVANATTLLAMEGVPVRGQLPGSDAENASLTWEIVTAPASGTLVLDAATGVATYAPVLGTTGDVTFTFRVSDGWLWSPPATATVRITARLEEVRPQVVSSPPRLGILGDPLDYFVVVDVSALPPGADLTFAVVGSPAASTVTLTKTGPATATLTWTANGAPEIHLQVGILVGDPASGTSDYQPVQVLWRTTPGGPG